MNPIQLASSLVLSWLLGYTIGLLLSTLQKFIEKVK